MTDLPAFVTVLGRRVLFDPEEGWYATPEGEETSILVTAHVKYADDAPLAEHWSAYVHRIREGDSDVNASGFGSTPQAAADALTAAMREVARIVEETAE